MPLSDFKKNVEGGNFDMVHLKDWTLNNLRPVGSTVDISNFVLVGNCPAIPTTTSVAKPTQTTTKSSGSATSGSSVLSYIGGALAAISQLFF